MTGCLIHTAIILSFTAQSYFFLIRQETDSEAACVDFLEDQAVCYAAVKEDVVWSILSPPAEFHLHFFVMVWFSSVKLVIDTSFQQRQVWQTNKPLLQLSYRSSLLWVSLIVYKWLGLYASLLLALLDKLKIHVCFLPGETVGWTPSALFPQWQSFQKPSFTKSAWSESLQSNQTGLFKQRSRTN